MNRLERALILGAALSCAGLLGGCNKTDSAASSGATVHGRYAGVGVVEAGRNWSNGIIANRPTNDLQAAMTAHDDHIIVVVDTTTGAIKQCGDVSGYCIGERNLDPVGPTRAVKPFAVPSGDAAAADIAAAADAAASDALASSN